MDTITQDPDSAGLRMNARLGIVHRAMTKTLLAEYDAGQNALKLLEPLPELKDHDQVRVVIETDQDKTDRPWLVLSGALSVEAGDSLAEAVERLYGRKSAIDAKPTPLALEGCLSVEAGESFSKAVGEMFPEDE